MFTKRNKMSCNSDMLVQCHIKDRKNVDEKLEKFFSDGEKNFIVISDFDHTLSKYKDDSGIICDMSYSLFETGLKTDLPNLAAKLIDLTAKYMHIELCSTMSVAEKSPYMIEWWENSHKCIMDANLTRDTIMKLVEKSTIQLRHGVKDLVMSLAQHQIPLVIYSAGIGNVIDTCFKREFGRIPNIVHMISNQMLFDDEGRVSGFSSPLVHTFNKNLSLIQEYPSIAAVSAQRSNVMLIGDSIGDSQMTSGFESEMNILKIGYLNMNIDERLEEFMSRFDIVLADDQTVQIPQFVVDGVFCRK